MYEHIHTDTHTLHVCACVCVCMRVCVYVRARELYFIPHNAPKHYLSEIYIPLPSFSLTLRRSLSPSLVPSLTVSPTPFPCHSPTSRCDWGCSTHTRVCSRSAVQFLKSQTCYCICNAKKHIELTLRISIRFACRYQNPQRPLGLPPYGVGEGAPHSTRVFQLLCGIFVYKERKRKREWGFFCQKEPYFMELFFGNYVNSAQCPRKHASFNPCLAITLW